MGGVDRVDQQLHSYNFLRKSYKWYRKLVIRLFLQAVLNSHKVYQKITLDTKMTFFEFLKDVITRLVMHDVPLPINNSTAINSAIINFQSLLVIIVKVGGHIDFTVTIYLQ